MKRLTLLLALLMPLALIGCNTMEGMGKDMSAAGDKLEKSAQEHRSY